MAAAKKNGSTEDTLTKEDIETVTIKADGNLGSYDLSEFEEEQVGFAPYWTPSEGKFFLAKVKGIDAQDPEFLRFTFEAATDTACQRGSKTTGTIEDVNVKPGETFSCSVYYQLRNLFEEVLLSGIDAVIRVQALREVPTSKKGQTCWQFGVMLPKTERAQLHAYRAKVAALKMKEEREARQFEQAERKSINVEGRRTA